MFYIYLLGKKVKDLNSTPTFSIVDIKCYPPSTLSYSPVSRYVSLIPTRNAEQVDLLLKENYADILTSYVSPFSTIEKHAEKQLN